MEIKNRKGSVLVGIIIALILVASLGAGVVMMNSASTMNELRMNNLNRAQNVAEAGLRYRELVEYDKASPTQTYTLSTGDTITTTVIEPVPGQTHGRRTISTGIVEQGTSMEARKTLVWDNDVKGQGLPDFIKENFNDLSLWDYNSDRVTVNYNIISDWGTHSRWATFNNMGGANSQKSDSAFAGCASVPNIMDPNASPGNTPGFAEAGWQWDSSQFYPNPQNGADPVHDSKSFRSGSLSSYGYWDTAQAATQFTMTTQAGTVSFYYKTQNMHSRNRFIVYVYDADSGNVVTDTGYLSHVGGWTYVTLSVPEGEHIFQFVLYKRWLSSSDDIVWVDDFRAPDTPANVTFKYEQIRLKGSSVENVDWELFWLAGDRRLSYDVQVKHGWGLRLPLGANGINFRWHPHPTLNTLFQGYGISWMYHSGLCTSDYIANSIKPEGDATAYKPLLVLWEQTVEGGQEVRNWLAYIRLDQIPWYGVISSPAGSPPTTSPTSYNEDPWVLAPQWSGDGQVFNDLSSLWLRVEELIDLSGRKYNKIKVFYGDASYPTWANGDVFSPPRRRNSDAGSSWYYDWSRKIYPPSYATNNGYGGGWGDNTATWDDSEVKWPNYNVGQWNNNRDYMTLINWDRSGAGINSSSDVRSVQGGFALKSTKHLTPDSGGFPKPNQYGGDEVGLHVFGKITFNGSGSFDVISFDDFAVRILGDTTD